MFCGKCGAENPDTNRFCIKCGVDLSQVTPPEKKAKPSDIPSDIPSDLDVSVSGKGTSGDVVTPIDRSVSGHKTGGDVSAPIEESVSGQVTFETAEDAGVFLGKGAVLANRYEIKSLLGRGGMGAVYKVWDRKLGEEIALKVLLPSLLQREKAVERFYNEAKVSLKLSHKNIVRVRDFGDDEEKGLLFITMELVRGRSLREWLKEKKERGEQVPTPEALRIVGEILEGLEYAHRYTIHRDLKPENIMLTGEGEVKIMDFGIAKLLSPAKFTSTSMAMGTAYYMAPEQQTDAARVDQRADIFSVCVILYELLTGTLPVGRFKTPSEIRKAIPKETDSVILKSLEPSPEDRYASVRELLSEIRRIGEVLPREERPEIKKHREPGSSLWKIVKAATVLIVLLGVLAGVYYGYERFRAARVESLFEEAKGLAGAQRYDAAVIKFRELRSFYPDSEFSRRAEAEILECVKKKFEGGLALVEKGDLEGALLVMKEIRFRYSETPYFSMAEKEIERLQREKKADAKRAKKPPAAAAPQKPIRVLYVDGLPRWEYKFLKEFLSRETDVHAQCLLLSTLREKTPPGSSRIGPRSFPRTVDALSSYDVVILGNVALTALPAEGLGPLSSWVREKGGGLVLSALTRANLEAFRGTPLELLFPVRISELGKPPADEVHDQPIRPVATESGRADPLTRPIFVAKEPWPSTFIVCGLGRRVKSHVRVLATDPISGGALITKTKIGRGNVIYLGIQTWRWRFGNPTRFERFWSRVIRHASGKAGAGTSKRVETDSKVPHVVPAKKLAREKEKADLELKAHALQTKRAVELTERGVEKDSKGDLNGAIAEYNKAIELDPKYALAYYNRGVAKEKKGDLDGAIADYDKAIELDPNSADAYSNRGSIRDDRGDLDGAILDYNKAIELDPKYKEAYINRGVARYKKDDLDGAIADCNRAIEIDPNSADAYNNRGAAKEKKGDLDGAIADYTRVIEINPKYARAYNNRGIAKEKKGHKKGAEADFGKARELGYRPEPDVAEKAAGERAGAEVLSPEDLWWTPTAEQKAYALKAKQPLCIENSIGMKLVLIPPGTFMMGSPSTEKGRDNYETQHRVTLTKGFYMGSTEVTQAQYRTVIGGNPSRFKDNDRPVENVRWDDADTFCKKLTERERRNRKIGPRDLYRLPTEAEWEYACRAGTTTPFHFGETISTAQANYHGDFVYGSGGKGLDRGGKGLNRGKTTKVGIFPANAFGLYDMHGNVWEKCKDWYEKYPTGPVTDPEGPGSGSIRVIRGGSWVGEPRSCRSARRGWSVPVNRYSHEGFRVVLIRAALKER
jgi:formylglycine-generating enzyme required for sulfatase activity/Flp pilus assembly protein TadD